MDACAAPGNKSTHAAALLRGRGKVLAVDRDAARLKILEERVREAKAADVVQAVRGDFLKLRHGGARAILVDPSCSGGFEGEAASDGRVARLAEFQSKAFRAALTRFPRAERVSYSTCSLRVEEDEAVVAGALADAVGKGGWRLAPALPAWPRRGRPRAGSGAERRLRAPIRCTDATGHVLRGALRRRRAGATARGSGRPHAGLVVAPKAAAIKPGGTIKWTRRGVGGNFERSDGAAVLKRRRPYLKSMRVSPIRSSDGVGLSKKKRFVSVTLPLSF